MSQAIASLPVSSLIGDELITVTAVPTVANEMFDRDVRHVLVANRTGLAGIVSARDLFGVYAAEDTDWDA